MLSTLVRPLLASLALAALWSAAIGCDGSRSAARQSPAAAPDSYLVAVHILSRWPDHPALKFDARQSGPDGYSPAPRDPDAHQLTREELDRVLARSGPQRAAILASPRVVTRPGERAAVRIGNDAPDGSPHDGLMVAVTPSPDPATGRTRITLDFAEYAPDPDGKLLTGIELNIKPGHAAAVLATGMIGGTQRLLLIQPESYPPARTTGNQFLDNLNYPKVTVMTALSELSEAPDLSALNAAASSGSIAPRPLAIRAAGSNGWTISSPGDSAAPAPRSAWAMLIPQDRLSAYFNALSAQPGHRHIASPAALLSPRQWDVIEPASTDKAHSPVNSRLEFLADPAGAQLNLSMRWAARDNTPIAAADHLPVPEGFLIAAVIPPSRGTSAPWRTITITPELVLRPADYPVQTFHAEPLGLDIPPRGRPN